MGSIIDTTKTDMETRLSTSWVVVMLYMAFIDVLSFACAFMDIPAYKEEILKTAGSTPVSTLMLAAAVMLMAPIAMIFFSRVLKQSINRWANIIVGIVTILFVVGGYVAYPHYYLLGSLEVLFTLYIIWSAWKWRK